MKPAIFQSDLNYMTTKEDKLASVSRHSVESFVRPSVALQDKFVARTNLQMLLSFHHPVLLFVVHLFVSLQECHIAPWSRIFVATRLVDLKEVLDQFLCS